jgi:hypothetical protein
MKILTTIVCYSGKSNPYITEVANNLKNVSDVVIFSPEEMDIPNTKTVICSKSLGKDMTFIPRQYIKDRLYDYDYFLYNEDDVLIKESSLFFAINKNEEVSRINLQNNVGFLRYELENNIPEFVDLAPYNSVHLGGNGVSDIIRCVTSINNEYYFLPWNYHSGNFLLSKSQLELLVGNNEFPVQPINNYAGIIESAASGLYHVMRKVIPVNDYKELMVHHMSNRYIFNPVKVSTDLLDNLFKFIPEDLSKEYLNL